MDGMKRFMVQAVGVDGTLIYNVLDTHLGIVVDSFYLHTRATGEAMILNEDDGMKMEDKWDN